jgi:hypothetical protein
MKLILALLTTCAISLWTNEVQAMRQYATNTGISQSRLRHLSYYSPRGQTSRDVRRILRNSPNYVDRDYESYTIRETVDYYQGVPLNAGQRLIVRYGSDGKTANWYVL